MRAVDALMECLKAEGVDVVFGLPGGANLPTYDAFVNGGIRHILVRHEAGGGHAAEGYAKATGKVGVAFATSGPGATNLITPICDAMMDSVPVVFITGQVRTELLGTDGFQEADTIGITMPVVEALVHDPAPAGTARGRSTRRSTSRAVGAPGAGADRHPAGPLARGDRLRAGDRRAPARLPAAGGGQPEADPPGCQGAGGRAASGDLRGRRRGQRERLRGAARVRAQRPLPGDLHADGPRRVSRAGGRDTRSAVAGDARHARHARGQLRDGRGGPDLRGGRALRRPHHGQALGVRAAREVHPHRRGPGGDLKERARAHPDRGRRQARARQARDRVPRAGRRPGAPGCVVEPDRRLESQVPARLRGQRRHGDQAAVHGPGAVRGDRRRGDRHERRRPAPDVGGAVLRLPAAAPLDQLGRPGHDGLRAAGGDGRGGRRARAAGVLHRGRRLGADERAGAGDVRAEQHPDQGVHHEQRLSGHGPPVAGAVLGRQIQPRGHGRVPRLRQARRGLRRRPACASPTRPRWWRT